MYWVKELIIKIKTIFLKYTTFFIQSIIDNLDVYNENPEVTFGEHMTTLAGQQSLVLNKKNYFSIVQKIMIKF